MRQQSTVLLFPAVLLGGQDRRHASRCPVEDPGPAVPLENSQKQEGHGDGVLSFKDAISNGMMEHLTRMWAHSHLLCDSSTEHPCSLLWSRMVLPAVSPLCKDSHSSYEQAGFYLAIQVLV